jgi:hypothetical protein
MSSLRALLDWMVRSPWRAFLVLFLLSLAIRLHNMAQIPIWVFYPSPERELGAIVTSLRHTGEFADPYLLPTGPTAHLPSVYPYLLALVYCLFGFSWIAGYLIMLLVVLASSLLLALLPWFLGQFGLGRQPGFIAGLASAWIVVWPGHGEYLAGLFWGCCSSPLCTDGQEVASPGKVRYFLAWRWASHCTCSPRS